ncbi:D-alanyl-D-alanine carboxypeptidase family protein [Alicyclobacillus sp. ALC3]|uniref:D-alanyl-D-alanine carboxypeptidase family protein n=1 Tax=Alicyclobacillus sp. ALC3 TaxID=2796143 RepID=UPI002379B71C|nr:D-alanyl-D-alanine carboxypeptidase family protein [Alicyclobacillus sp. ALC3]WDL97089.1 D-alanyl-D-alanine carboxypeptidase [Alicyclobacillus sp. ALC3]
MGHGRKSILLASSIAASLLGTTPVFAAQTQSQSHIATAGGVEVQVHPGYTLQASSEAHQTSEASLAKNARSAVIMDAATGKVLFEKDADEELPPASITKVMTLLLIMEAMDSGRLKLSDSIRVSEYASSMGGSQIFLEPGETMSAADMIKGIAVGSANDACVAMAEYLDGTEENFVKRMNKRAQQLGMEHTHFVNCNGLPAEGHYSSAEDIAIMSRELLKHPEITRWTSVYSDYLRKDSDHPLWLVNTNKLVRFYDGVDGLKTGFTQAAKYCLSATAVKDGFRVIAVVMGEPRSTVRNAEVTSMLNWSFSQYRSKVLYKPGQPVQEIKVVRGVPERVPAVVGDTVGFVFKSGETPHVRTEVQLAKVQAPVRKGEQVGKLVVYNGEHKVAEIPLLAGADAKRAGFWTNTGRTIRGIVTFGAQS